MAVHYWLLPSLDPPSASSSLFPLASLWACFRFLRDELRKGNAIDLDATAMMIMMMMTLDLLKMPVACSDKTRLLIEYM